MAILESNNRHAELNRQKLKQVKELTSDLEGWEFSQENQGVKLYSKQLPDSAIPVVRGDYLLKTTAYTAEQVALVATLPGCRAIWDEKFNSSEVKEVFTKNESLFWVRTNTPWPISNRDFAGCRLCDIEQDLSYVSMASVEDPSVPEVSGCVRGTLITSGWKTEKVADGILISYVSQVDLAGSIPSSFLNSVRLQMPLCAGKVAEYITEYGFPPLIRENTCEIGKVDFDHAKRTYTAALAGEGSATYEFSSTMYPNGVKVDVSAGEANVDGNTISISGINGNATLTITKA
ncbi:hypothetical protein BC940DRAFT_328519 [Gongronella butleri]|nr:hypothetical protein BC940DRAFT_328519 [Gongronella butleri]